MALKRFFVIVKHPPEGKGEMAQAKGRKGRGRKGKGLTRLLNANPKGTGEKAKGLRLCMVVTLDPERLQSDTQPAPVSC